jgi:hypothetical protein
MKGSSPFVTLGLFLSGSVHETESIPMKTVSWARRIASINDLPISESVRKFFWLLGRCPDDHAGLSELGL